MMIKKITSAHALLERHHKLQKECEFIEDPTFSRSIGSHVCMTCSEFDYSSQVNIGSILCCKWHQKLIFHGQHLTHSCELYQKKTNLGIQKKLNQVPQAA